MVFCKEAYDGWVDYHATMALMQMISDSYESALGTWEGDGQGTLVASTDNPGECGLNSAQKSVLSWLIDDGFLPSTPLLRPLEGAGGGQEASPPQKLAAAQTPPATPRKLLGINVPRRDSLASSFSSDSKETTSLSLSRLWKRAQSNSTSSGFSLSSDAKSTSSICPSKLWRRARSNSAASNLTMSSDTSILPPAKLWGRNRRNSTSSNSSVSSDTSGMWTISPKKLWSRVRSNSTSYDFSAASSSKSTCSGVSSCLSSCPSTQTKGRSTTSTSVLQSEPPPFIRRKRYPTHKSYQINGRDESQPDTLPAVPKCRVRTSTISSFNGTMRIGDSWTYPISPMSEASPSATLVIKSADESMLSSSDTEYQTPSDFDANPSMWDVFTILMIIYAFFFGLFIFCGFVGFFRLFGGLFSLGAARPDNYETYDLQIMYDDP